MPAGYVPPTVIGYLPRWHSKTPRFTPPNVRFAGSALQYWTSSRPMRNVLPLPFTAPMRPTNAVACLSQNGSLTTISVSFGASGFASVYV